MKRPLLVLAALASCLTLTAPAHAAEKRLNVLFIMVDDLRPELSCYGSPHVRTPHIDQLAARGLVFERAYCQQSHCASSSTLR